MRILSGIFLKRKERAETEPAVLDTKKKKEKWSKRLRTKQCLSLTRSELFQNQVGGL